jgi:hypothetical protein
MNPFRKLIDRVLLAWDRLVLDRTVGKFFACLDGELLDEFLELLLRMMSLSLRVDPRFRRNIANYEVRYLFRSRDGTIVTSAEFHDGHMRVREGAIANPDITVDFKDGKALRNFLLSENPDLIGSLLDGDIAYVGNLNYLGKLAYMAKHLQRKFMPA